MNSNLDPISFAVVKSALDALIDEVAYTVVWTARSEIVKDVMDYSAALCDGEGRMVVQAKTIALHLGAVPEAMQEVLARHDNDLRPGDAVILNDPYQGGMHLPDIRSEEQTSELQSLMRLSYAVFCLKKKKHN